MAEQKFFGAAQELRTRLNESLNQAKNPLEIILELAELLGEMTGDETFHETVREQILSIYGLALGDKFILDDEIAAVKARLEKISAAYENPAFTDEEHTRIGYALESHKSEIERLERLKNVS